MTRSLSSREKMSNERSPRLVCSMTNGTSGLTCSPFFSVIRRLCYVFPLPRYVRPPSARRPRRLPRRPLRPTSAAASSARRLGQLVGLRRTAHGRSATKSTVLASSISSRTASCLPDFVQVGEELQGVAPERLGVGLDDLEHLVVARPEVLGGGDGLEHEAPLDDVLGLRPELLLDLLRRLLEHAEIRRPW